MKAINFKKNVKVVFFVMAFCFLWSAPLDLYGQSKMPPEAYRENHAYIVVTGIKLDENPDNYMKDWSVAKGAIVKLISSNGQIEEKETQPFAAAGKGEKEIYYTADFKVAFDSTYVIEMKFKDGSLIRISDYKLPSEWKRHFYYHSTNQTKSPASVMRMKKDEITKLACCVYALFPYKNYVTKGGKQLRTNE